MPPFLTAALYKFVRLSELAPLQARVRAACDRHRIKGTILLAEEGINGTIAGAADDLHAMLAWLRADPRLSDLEAKLSWAEQPPFLRMKVRIKAEIVSLRADGVDPNRMAGRYVEPQQWNALISDPDVVVVDTRNDYEVAIGSFEGAVDPGTRSFSDLPAWVAGQSQPGGLLAERDGRKPKVAMFCTGGIRCEKSTALLRQQGFDEVYHLKGGILKYLETVAPQDSLWQGACFVFDERVSVGHGLAQGDHTLCRSCRRPLGPAERASPAFVDGIACPYCAAERSDAQKRGFAERQRQVALARARGQEHVGARMPEKPPRSTTPQDG